ncbi:MAG TPA: GNAT family N-acetyltransferase [Roseomonas sp.]|jgi:ribosomal-protein-alanine N-acetyltransferase
MLRAALAHEAAVLAAIHAEAFAPPEAWGADAIALMLEASGGFGVLALDGAPPFGKEPLGFALARAMAGEAEVLTLAVRPGARRRGIGRALFTALAEQAAARGAEALFLEVAQGNLPARGLYAGCDATEVGRRRRYYADGSDALVLRVALPA